MKTWKWSLGEAYYKSARQDKTKQNNNDSDIDAIEQSLNENIFNTKGARREDIDSKLADREMLAQCGINPFLMNNSYVNDVVTRDMFLKPLCTTHERIKTEKD